MSSRSPLILLHGFMGRGVRFKRMMACLPQKLAVIPIDLPGHGQSLFSKNHRLRTLTAFQEVAALILEDLQKLGVSDFHLYGYSMGGRVAQSIALMAPGKVKTLILESASFGIQDTAARRRRHADDLNLLGGIRTQGDFYNFLATWYAMPLFAGLAHTAIPAELIQCALENDIEELKKALAILSVGHHPFWAHDLARLKIPIYYFFGNMDKKYALLAAQTKTIIPHLCLRPFENASHNIHIQYPQMVAEEIAAIIAKRETHSMN